MTTPTDDATKRTPAKIIAACRTALNLLDVPAAPVGDDTRLIDELRDVAQVSRVQYGTQSSSAKTCERVITRLTSQAARIAELERSNEQLLAHVTTLIDESADAERQLAAERKSRTEWAVEQEQELATWMRQLAAAQACIAAADAMVDFVFCVDREAYDKARLRFAGDDALAPGSP